MVHGFQFGGGGGGGGEVIHLGPDKLHMSIGLAHCDTIKSYNFF